MDHDRCDHRLVQRFAACGWLVVLANELPSDRGSSFERALVIVGHGSIQRRSGPRAKMEHIGPADDDRPAEDAAAHAQGDRDVDRIIVVSPGDGISYLERLYARTGRAVPAALNDWDARIDQWCDEYEERFESTRLLEVFVEHAVYWFDEADRYERVVIAYGISKRPDASRDSNRMRRFPNVNVGVRANLGAESFDADRGHWLSHSSGGELDINLFPQRRELNRGWSDQGKVFRRMEAAAAGTPGSFHFHRAAYDDDTWIPATLQYGVLRNDREWWIEDFANK